MYKFHCNWFYFELDVTLYVKAKTGRHSTVHNAEQNNPLRFMPLRVFIALHRAFIKPSSHSLQTDGRPTKDSSDTPTLEFKGCRQVTSQ